MKTLKSLLAVSIAVFLGSISQVLLAQNAKSITFRNGSLHSIPLVIPGVMNPNLSPLSNSGVTLEVGQEVFYFPNGKKEKKELLFMVEESWSNDTTLYIDELIKAKQKLTAAAKD